MTLSSQNNASLTASSERPFPLNFKGKHLNLVGDAKAFFKGTLRVNRCAIIVIITSKRLSAYARHQRFEAFKTPVSLKMHTCAQ